MFAKAPRGDLEPTEQLQLTFFTRAFLRGVQNISFQRRAGLVSGCVWEDYEHVLGNYTRLPYAKQFRAGGRHGFDAAFVDRCDPLFVEPPAASS